jgi:hypothetical protein
MFGSYMLRQVTVDRPSFRASAGSLIFPAVLASLVASVLRRTS